MKKPRNEVSSQQWSVLIIGIFVVSVVDPKEDDLCLYFNSPWGQWKELQVQGAELAFSWHIHASHLKNPQELVTIFHSALQLDLPTFWFYSTPCLCFIFEDRHSDFHFEYLV
jgi:hypothetical protein